MLGTKGALLHMSFVFYLAAPALLPAFYWAWQGLMAALGGRGPGFGPGAAVWAALVCAGFALAWLWLPVSGPGPDGLLEETKTKALLPDEWRGELCSSIVSNQS